MTIRSIARPITLPSGRWTSLSSKPCACAGKSRRELMIGAGWGGRRRNGGGGGGRRGGRLGHDAARFCADAAGCRGSRRQFPARRARPPQPVPKPARARFQRRRPTRGHAAPRRSAPAAARTGCSRRGRLRGRLHSGTTARSDARNATHRKKPPCIEGTPCCLSPGHAIEAACRPIPANAAGRRDGTAVERRCAGGEPDHRKRRANRACRYGDRFGPRKVVDSPRNALAAENRGLDAVCIQAEGSVSMAVSCLAVDARHPGR